MAAESNVGARLFLIGKDGVLAGLNEITAATARLNAEIARGAGASKVAAGGYAEQEAGLAALGTKMDLYQASMLKSAAATDALASVGKKAFFGIGAAAAVWTYESIRWAQNYQTALVQLRTQAGLTVTAMNAIGKAAMANSAGLGISPSAYLQAAYHPASTGFGTAQTISITNYGAKLAAIGNAPVEDTVNALTGVTKSFGYGNNQTEHTAALLNAIVGAGNMHWSDLNSALASGIAASSKTFGVSLTSMGGALARLTDLGTPAAQAGTRLRMSLALLGGPSQESSKLLTAAGMGTSEQTSRQGALASALVAAGLSTTQLSGALRNNSGAGGIYNALELLKQHLSGLDPETSAALISRAFGGGRMGTSIMQLYGNLPALSQKSNQINQGATNKKFQEDWITTTKTLRFQLHELGGELETLGTQFGTAVLPPLTKVVGGFTDLLKFFGKNKDLAIGLGTAITAVLVPAIGVFLYRALLSSGGAIRTVIAGYGQLITGQTLEQGSLARTDMALQATTGQTYRLVAADRALTGASETSGGAGLAGGIGKYAGAAGLAGLSLYAGSKLAGPGGLTLNSRASNGQQLRTALASVLGFAGAGAALGSVIPGIGTLAGGLGGAAVGGIYSERHQIGSALKSGWDDLFGGGSSSSPQATASAPRLNANVNVYLDSKQLKDAIVKQVQASAARV